MKKDALDRLIEKNQKQKSIESKESNSAIKNTVLGIVFFFTLIPVA